MTTLYLDTETFCEVPITSGTHAYAEQAELLLIPYAWDDEEPVVEDVSGPGEWDAFKPRLQAMVDLADEIVIHNSAFDRTVLRHMGVTIPPEKVRDTMVQALQHSLPGSLDMLCGILGVPVDKAKDKEGKKLIQLFCKPLPKNRRLRRATRDTHPEEWAKFTEYARLDVVSMRDVYRRLPAWNCSPRERELWLLDQRINDRGVAVDRELATAAGRAFARTARTLATRASVLTGGVISSLTQRAKLTEYLEQRHGVALPDMTKGTVSASLKADDLNPEVRELLEIRQQASATSPAKYGVILKAASSDDRLRGTIQFCGASRTGRDAGRIFQPQNLPRPTLPSNDIDIGIQAMKLDCEDFLFDNVSELCASAVRGCLVAEEGKKFVICDLSNIEGRVAAWLAGEEWKVQAFYDFDKGTGHDLYALSYAQSFNVTPEAVIDNKENGDGSMRQIGKVQDLSLGYQGSVGAYVTMGANYGVDPVALAVIVRGVTSDEVWQATKSRYEARYAAGLEPETWTGIKIIVDAWRGAHRRIQSMWYDIENAVKHVLRNPEESCDVRGLGFDVVQHNGSPWLRIKLPSGRYLSYPSPRIGEDCPLCLGTGEMPAPEDPSTMVECWECGGTGLENTQIFYMGVHQTTKQWCKIASYGGKFFENIVQAIARDIFMGGLKRAMDAGYFVVLRVHDELVCEVPDDPSFTVDALAELMVSGETWSPGLPLAAAGHEMYRYAKGD